MTETNENFKTQPEAIAVKKDNILPIVAVSLASAALLISLFTAGMGAAVASPDRHHEREHATVSHEQEGKHAQHGKEFSHSQEGKQQHHPEHKSMNQEGAHKSEGKMQGHMGGNMNPNPDMSVN